jgi:Tol biopolymer transport system component
MTNRSTNRSLFAVVVITALFSLFSAPAHAQAFSSWSVPEPLGPEINTPGVLEGCPFISKDNLTLFFASNRSGGSGAADIWASTRLSEDTDWTTPFNLGPVLNSSSAEVCPTYHISGRYLYFVSARPGGCGGDDIYVARLMSKKDLTSWSTPENLGCQFNSSQNDITPSLFEDEDGTVYMYFSSNRTGGLGGMDIYVSVQQSDGTFGTPVNVAELNTTANDMRPNIRYRDGLEIFFESNRPGVLGQNDLFSATRSTTSDTWSLPESLGPIVNSTFTEGRPSLSFDGTTLYFMSNRDDAANNIYVTRRSRLKGNSNP